MDALLDGVCILDFSEYIAGPYCGFLMADMGAEVIKIEPLDGAEERRFGNQKRYKNNTRLSLAVNRGKKSICVDLRQDEGRNIVYKLVEKADITIQNFAPGVAEKLGIDYETLSKINKRLIFVSSTAFGEVGPYRQRKGFDIIAHAASGVMAYYADEKGRPKGPGGLAYIDVSTGMLNALGAIAALYKRDRTGEGQKIETSLFKTGMALQAPGLVLIDELDNEQHQEELDILDTARQDGKKHTEIIDKFMEMRLRYDQPDTLRPVEVPDCDHRPTDRQTYPYYRIYETLDGYLSIAALNRKQRKNLCDVLELHDHGVDADIGNVSDDQYYNQKEIMERIEDRLKGKSTNEWIHILEDAGVPCGQVNYNTNIFYDPQAKATNMIWDLENSVLGRYKMAGHPVKYKKTPVAPQKGAPSLGEHTTSILSRLGYTKEDIHSLREAKVIR